MAAKTKTVTKARRMREMLKAGIVVSPGIFDGYSARLVEKMGFKAASTTGAGLSNSRLGQPDIGIMSLMENVEACRALTHIMSIPVMADADTGYGNSVTVYHTVQYFEAAGVVGINIEDQVSPKRCGHMAGKQVVPSEEMEAKLRAMTANRMNPDTFIVARTDARAIHGMDEALRRAERYVRAGADGVFIESMLNEDEIARAVREVQTCHVANMLEGGITPILTPAVLGQMGYGIALYGITLLLRITKTMQMALADLKSGELKLVGSGTPFEEYTKIVGVEKWRKIEQDFGGK